MYSEQMDFLVDGPDNAKTTFVFAHGAGGGMDTPFMNDMARLLAGQGLRVARFEFPYMVARRTVGKRSAPDREPVLLQSWRDAIAQQRSVARRLVIGGKSLGGRMASMVADELGVAGLICVGYPFHPPGQPFKLRTAHLVELRTPTLIVQGTRDPFGPHSEVSTYRLSPSILFEWIEDGDHSLKTRTRSGTTPAEALERAAIRMARFCGSL